MLWWTSFGFFPAKLLIIATRFYLRKPKYRNSRILFSTRNCKPLWWSAQVLLPYSVSFLLLSSYRVHFSPETPLQSLAGCSLSRSTFCFSLPTASRVPDLVPNCSSVCRLLYDGGNIRMQVIVERTWAPSIDNRPILGFECWIDPLRNVICLHKFVFRC